MPPPSLAANLSGGTSAYVLGDNDDDTPSPATNAREGFLLPLQVLNIVKNCSLSFQEIVKFLID